MDTWRDRSNVMVDRLGGGDPDRLAYRQADAEMIRRTLKGYGPDSAKARPEAGVRVVFNIPAVHVPAFVNEGAATDRSRPYKNRYDLADDAMPSNKARAGEKPPSEVSTRARIDTVLAWVAKASGGGASERSLYYGAAELNGAGIRYYGDLCLVLKPDEVSSDTLLLDRNSFDLARRPIRDRILAEPDKWLSRSVDEVRTIEGRWAADICDMAVCKVMGGSSDIDRLLTTATISDRLLGDEDYIEVVRTGSFGWNDLEEVRVSAADAGAEGRVADRLSRGPTPSQTELLWRHRRRAADRALGEKGVRSRIVVTTGRARV